MAVKSPTSVNFTGPISCGPDQSGWILRSHEILTGHLTAEWGKPPQLTLKSPEPVNTQEPLLIGEEITHDGKPVTFLSNRSTLVERFEDPSASTPGFLRTANQGIKPLGPESARVTVSPLRIRHTQKLKSASPDHCATLNAKDQHEFTIVIKPDSPAAITTTDETKWLGQKIDLPQPLEQAQLTALRTTKTHDGVALVFRINVLEQMWRQAAIDFLRLWLMLRERKTFAERIIKNSARRGDWETVERWAAAKQDRCVLLAASHLGQHRLVPRPVMDSIRRFHTGSVHEALQRDLNNLERELKGEK